MPDGIAGPLDIETSATLMAALGILLFSAVAAPAPVTVLGDTTLAATPAQLAAATDRTQALTGETAKLQVRG